ncbi:MAG: trypsin-like peptidase domain-containing protein [Candidatus Neomarinimicrobiota bacterium]|jgi:serine protease Do|nr:trypsin-like peptidase domain-containing protein [Candidatus Neomarinimicrobiota bacterium]|tara:strand:- start:456 stop:1541 length:1086 start_codon:yes stop_codon:yes gene_type:complete
MINSHTKVIVLMLYIAVNIFAQPNVNSSRKTAITRAIEKVGPAVACINVQQNVSAYTTSDPFFRYFFPPEIYPMKSSGSGVVISPDGYVLTNTHVVENASKISVTLSGGDEYDAEVIGVDKTSDLALLLLNGNNFPFAEMGDSDDLIIGEWVIALGNPFELFSVSNQPTASVGIISANHMDFGMQKESGRVLQNMMQTDAAINPGNSGGPLVNTEGKVIGINTFIFTGSNYNRGSIGIGFAIPINTAKRIAKELKTSGSIDRSFTTGLVVQPLTRSMIRHLNIPFRDGVIVVHVDKNSSAQKAGIAIGDIIVTAAGNKVNSPSDIRDIIAEKDLRSGDTIKFKIFRENAYLNIRLKLGSYR